MKIEEFISCNVFEERLEQRVLAVYDAEKRYHQLCLDLASENLTVVDTTESSILSREQAIEVLAGLGKNGQKLLVYVPKGAPISDEEKQRDPFSLYGAAGKFFPDGDGDSYMNLCLKAKPDHQAEIRQVFAQDPNPSFSTINGIGTGMSWPILRELLKTESTQEIIRILMLPTDAQHDALSDSTTWIEEAKTLLEKALGLTLMTRSENWEKIGQELRRFVLFSEFVFDLPEALPESLADVPRAPKMAQTMIESLCETIRQTGPLQDRYIQCAEEVENELDLVNLCESVVTLGVRDTFPFEERTFLHAAIEAVEKGEIDSLSEILSRHKNSIWINRGENQTQWDLVQAAKNLIESSNDLLRELPEHSTNQNKLIDFYLNSLREADRLQREFEQAAADAISASDLLDPVKIKARKAYRQLSEKVQILFTKQLANSGWPPQGRMNNADVFDDLVEPKLRVSGQRVAYIMVDALRYELGLELEKQLKDNFETTLRTSCANLPSITLVGMASLLPGAKEGLTLERKDNKIHPMLNGMPVGQMPQRMGVFEKRYGSRFAESRVEDFVNKKIEFDSVVELAVLRSVEIDTQFENSAESAPTAILRELKYLRIAINRLQDQGFNHVVIATDHGFFMNNHLESGDVCPKPHGDWLITHDRMALGSGTVDQHQFMMAAEKAGLKGQFTHIAGPNTMAAYRDGKLYFHGGASLQECVLPVMEIKLKPQQPETKVAKVILAYKKGTADAITSRRPIIEVCVSSDDLFADAETFEMLIEAHKYGSKMVVGEAKIGGEVNAATRTITVHSGESKKVTLIMDGDFEGNFFVKALNPNTLVEYAKMKLTTDYVV